MNKEIPILYSTSMVQAKLAWRKTQTRRLAKNHPGNQYPDDECWHTTHCSFQTYYSEDHAGDGNEKELGPEWLILNEDGDIDGFLGKCPYGKPGDLLWGRESMCFVLRDHAHDLLEGMKSQFVYKASVHPDWMEYAKERHAYKWTPSIHMPKAAARIWDEITGIRVERIADISEEDCIAEGIEPVGENVEFGGEFYPGKWYKNYLTEGYTFLRPYDSYRSLWQLLHGTPKPIQARQKTHYVTIGDHTYPFYQLVTVGYEVYPFDEQAAAPFKDLTTWRGKPLTVITNPWVWVVESKQLSVTGNPE